MRVLVWGCVLASVVVVVLGGHAGRQYRTYRTCPSYCNSKSTVTVTKQDTVTKTVLGRATLTKTVILDQNRVTKCKTKYVAQKVTDVSTKTLLKLTTTTKYSASTKTKTVTHVKQSTTTVTHLKQQDTKTVVKMKTVCKW